MKELLEKARAHKRPAKTITLPRRLEDMAEAIWRRLGPDGWVELSRLVEKLREGRT
jgi:hypothetical protein